MGSQKENNIVALIKLGKDKEVVPLLYKKVYPLVERFIMRNPGNTEDASDSAHRRAGHRGRTCRSTPRHPPSAG